MGVGNGQSAAAGALEVAEVVSLLRELAAIYDRLQRLTGEARAAAEAGEDEQLDRLLDRREQALESAAAALAALRAAAAKDTDGWRRCVAGPVASGLLAGLTTQLDAIHCEEAGILERLLHERGALLEQVMRLREGRVQLRGYAGMGQTVSPAHVDRRR